MSASGAGRGQMFPALHQRGFRLIWLVIALVNTSRWMEFLTIGWLVLERTNSPLLVGVAAAARSTGWLLGPVGGLLADRLDRRRLLIIIHSVNVTQASILLSLLALDRLELWHIVALALINGLTHAIDYPTRFALVADLVGRPALTKAIPLTRMAMDITTVAGPLLGGTLTALFTPVGSYALILALYATTVAVLLMVHPGPRSAPEESAWRNVVTGLSYLRGNQVARLILLLCLVANILGFPFTYALLPVFARDVLEVGPAGLGTLMASAGVGGLAGSLGLAVVSSQGRQGRLMMASFLFWPMLMVVFAASSWYGLSLGILVLAWACQSLAMNVTTSLLLAVVPPEMRGRIMGARALVIIGSPLGSLALGAMASRLGAPPTLVFSAMAFIAIVVALGLTRPQLMRVVVPGPARTGG